MNLVMRCSRLPEAPRSETPEIQERGTQGVEAVPGSLLRVCAHAYFPSICSDPGFGAEQYTHLFLPKSFIAEPVSPIFQAKALRLKKSE